MIILYHGTSKKSLKNILKKGLRRGSSLSTDKQITKEVFADVHDKEGCIIKFKVDKNKVKRYYDKKLGFIEKEYRNKVKLYEKDIVLIEYPKK